MSLKLMYITNDLKVSEIAQNAGVDRIFIDLEKLGKAERQGHLDSVKSDHSISDISKLRPLIKRSELLVRINPLNPGSKEEINAVIENGADILMLPMFKSAQEAERFKALVSGRVKTMLLIETLEAEESIEEILEVSGIDEIYIGLNDLHLAHNMNFMFELLADGTVEKLCSKINAKGIPFGFGGVSSIGNGVLPAECILAEHYRIGSSMVILSRSFCNSSDNNLERIESIFNQGVNEIREYERFLSKQSEDYFIDNKVKVKEIVDRMKENHQR